MYITIDSDFIYCRNPTREDAYYLENNLHATRTKKNGFRIPLNLWSLRELWNHFDDFHTESIRHVGEQLSKEVNLLTAVRKADVLTPFHQDLRPYQNADVNYLCNLPSAGVFNEPRTGKTPTMISLIKHLNPLKVIIVTPASLVYNWQREFTKWYPEKQTHVVKDNRAMTYYGGIVIISKDRLKASKHWQEQEYDLAIVDEAHFLRNYKTAQSKAVFKLKATRKYALTGTPSVKHAVDVFGILHFLYPRKFPSYWQFAGRYFEIGSDFQGHATIGKPYEHRLEELQTMVGLLSVQRKRKEVMDWLPDKQRTTFYCAMDSKQKRLYNDMLDFFATTDNDVELDAPNILSQLTRLRQLCLDPTLVGFDTPSAKTKSLVEYVQDLDEPVVIMSMFSSYLDVLENIFANDRKVAKITGIINSKEKQRIAEQFQRGEIDVLLCNIISAGTGFTLDKAETIIFTDKAWNPADNEQAEDRITPTTQDNVHKHHIVSFVCQDTVDEKINRLLDEKKSITDLINEGGMQAIKNLLSNT